MNLEEIKQAVDAGLAVRHGNDGYHVIKDRMGEYLIVFNPNGYTIGLTHLDGVTMNGRPEDFYIKEASDD